MKIILILFYQLLLSSAAAFVLGCLILLLKRIFGYRLSAKWHYYIWFLLVIKLLVPIIPESNLSMFNIITPVVQQVPAIEDFYPESADRIILDNQSNLGIKENHEPAKTEEKNSTEITLSSGEAPDRPADNTSGGRSNHYQDVLQKLFFIWLTGFTLLICFTVYENIKFKHKINHIILCTDLRTNGILERCMGKINVKRPIPIFHTNYIRAPLLYGVIKPKILIPTAFSENFSDEEIKYILLHELSHYKRKDILINWIFTIAQLIHWFNPMVWYGFYIMRQDCEIACDAEVLSCLEEFERISYGQTIINLLKLFTGSHFIPSTAGLAKSKSGIKRRITMISIFKRNRLASMLGAVALLVVIAMVGLPEAKLLANTDKIIHFKDSSIQAAAEKSLGFPVGSVIRESHMQKVKELDLQKVSDTSDMKYFTSLETLTLNSPMDLKLLNNIKTLKSLTLDYKVSDMKELKYCENLESLTLSSYTAENTDTFPPLSGLKDLSIGFEIKNTDLSGLKRLEQLNALGLYGLKGKSNINELGGMKQLKYLRLLRCNDLENIDSLSFLNSLQIIGKTKLTNNSLQALARFKNLKGFFIEELTIKDMKPFEKLTELESLTIMNAYITDISPLKNLTKLKTLNLAGNRIRDIGALENMKNLKYIELQVNKLENIQPLSGLSKIETLWLNENAISDISALSGVTNLKSLHLGNNKITDISPLSNLSNLKEVYLEENQIEIIKQLKGLDAIETLSLSSNRLSDISGLSELTNLRKADLWDNRIVDISPLEGLVNLAELNLSNNEIKNIKPLAVLSKIKQLSVSNNRISEISAVGAMRELVSLEAFQNPINDIAALVGLPKLQAISLGGIELNDSSIKALSGMSNLQRVSLNNNKLTDISFLKNLVNVESLNLSKNSISDINALASMNKLNNIYLQDNKIIDIDVLGRLNNLKVINLSNNKITDVRPLAKFPQAWLMLKGNNITDYSPISAFYNPADEGN